VIFVAFMLDGLDDLHLFRAPRCSAESIFKRPRPTWILLLVWPKRSKKPSSRGKNAAKVLAWCMTLPEESVS